MFIFSITITSNNHCWIDYSIIVSLFIILVTLRCCSTNSQSWRLNLTCMIWLYVSLSIIENFCRVLLLVIVCRFRLVHLPSWVIIVGRFFSHWTLPYTGTCYVGDALWSHCFRWISAFVWQLVILCVVLRRLTLIFVFILFEVAFIIFGQALQHHLAVFLLTSPL
jgi:hypothetical protein